MQIHNGNVWNSIQIIFGASKLLRTPVQWFCCAAYDSCQVNTPQRHGVVPKFASPEQLGMLISGGYFQFLLSQVASAFCCRKTHLWVAEMMSAPSLWREWQHTQHFLGKNRFLWSGSINQCYSNYLIQQTVSIHQTDCMYWNTHYIDSSKLGLTHVVWVFAFTHIVTL